MASYIGTAMLLRRWISVLALFGVLLHAGALVRHNTVMLGAERQHQALVSDLHQLCNSLGTVDSASLPDVPRPSDAQNGCPICTGLASLFALTAPEPAASPVRIERPIHQRIAVVALPEPAHTLHPPARGPPSLA